MRTDLLALSIDDLAALSNRGTVKRVLRDVDEGVQPSSLIEASDGTVTVSWPDEIVCVLPYQATLAESRCSCQADGVCRHLVGSVLAYQRQSASSCEPPGKPEPWDPGSISDETLFQCYRKAALSRLRTEFEAGHVFELLRGVKPVARIHTLGRNVRFLVPGDPRYTTCDCTESAPCSHVLLAIWAFRQLDAAAISGFVETAHRLLPTPENLLEDILAFLFDLVEVGLSGISGVSMRRLPVLVRRCRDEGLRWPADILEEVLVEYERYIAQDARFSAYHVAELIGELLIRCRAIRHHTGAIPAFFVRGPIKDEASATGTTRLIGIGCGVESRRGQTRLSAYTQDIDLGAVWTIQRDFADSVQAGAPQPPFWQLAQTRALRDGTLASIAANQLLVKGGKRSINGVFYPPRNLANLAPQLYDWETLRAPLLADGFREILAHLRAQPPTCVRSRRVGEDLAVCQIKKVEKVAFDQMAQAVIAELHDAEGETAWLYHPYFSRGAEGIDSLLWWMMEQSHALRFVSGHTRLGPRGLLILPLGLIFELDGKRQMVQPWISQRNEAEVTPVKPEPVAETDPTRYFPARVLEVVGDLCLTGLCHVEQHTVRQWDLLVNEGASLGFVRCVELVSLLAGQLADKLHHIDWDWRMAAKYLFEVAVVARFAQE